MLDEVHFQQYGSRCRMWIPPEEKDPVIRHHPTRKSVGYFGAVRLRDGKFVFQREDDSFNAKTCLKFFKMLKRKSVSPGRRIVVVLDNARYHHARLHKTWRKRNAGHFSFLFLPAYSPNLNMIERVWKLTRRRSIHNRYFSSITEVAEAVELQFKKWRIQNPTLLKLCAFNAPTQFRHREVADEVNPTSSRPVVG